MTGPMVLVGLGGALLGLAGGLWLSLRGMERATAEQAEQWLAERA